ncbi:MAG: T9SS type A sorting domain-containing protein, partial [Prevotellaceae bacterium]|nr:T9SS type A sorting domain-containing protein [Prevotellaceae bacterium]
YKITIPDDFTESEFVLDKGVIKVKGFGSYYGAHRRITMQNGVAPNLSASVREAYFGSIPEIRIPIPSNGSTITPTNVANIADVTVNNILVYPNPFVDYIIVNVTESGTATIFNLSGQTVLTEKLTSGKNHIATSALPKGVYLLKVGRNVVKLVK